MLGVKIGLATDVAGGYSPSMLSAIRNAVITNKVLKMPMMAATGRSFSDSGVFRPRFLARYGRIRRSSQYAGKTAMLCCHSSRGNPRSTLSASAPRLCSFVSPNMLSVLSPSAGD